jgi:DNA-binding IclR family transcriptional regulator
MIEKSSLNSAAAAPGRVLTGVKSGYRVAQVLDFFRDHPQASRAIEIAQSIDMPMSSANDLLKTLVDTGYLTFEPISKRYTLSLRIITLADSMTDYEPGLRSLLEAARALHKETQDSVAILAHNGNQMRFVYRLMGAYDGPQAVGVPILGTASGGALLMTMRSDDVARTIRRVTRSVEPSRRPTEIQRLLKKIDNFRTEGFAISDESAHPPGIRAIAIPVARRNADPLILGFGGPRSFSDIGSTISARRCAGLMRQLISEYSRPS